VSYAHVPSVSDNIGGGRGKVGKFCLVSALLILRHEWGGMERPSVNDCVGIARGRSKSRLCRIDGFDGE